MKNDIWTAVENKSCYLAVLEAVTGVKTGFTKEEKSQLLAVYADHAKNKYGFSDTDLVKALLALDVPGANLLGKADNSALTALSELCRDWEPDAEKAGTVKAAALAGNVSQPLALALARAALDAYAGQRDLTPFREDIKALAEFLKCADEDAFSDASMFLLRVRERVQ